MGKMAEVLLSRRLPGESAIDLLDKICRPYAKTDAEFESEDPNDPNCVHPDYDRYTDPHPKAALGMLMLEAFAPNGVTDLKRFEPMLADHPDSAAACDAWWEEVYGQLKMRYGFW